MKKSMLEIKIHDGPARAGIYGEITTPAVLPLESISLCEDEAMPYEVPRDLAKWSVEETLKKAGNCEEEFAVVHGSKYVDLRIECAKRLEEMGYRALMIANSDELLQRPRDLVKLVTSLRETVSPNTALCLPFADTSFLPLLTYMGLDLFSDSVCEFYGYLNIIMTPSASYNLEQYPLMELNTEELIEYNKKTLALVIKEIYENIKNGTLRNLVEQRSCSSPAIMSTLRILDKEYISFLEKYTPIH